MEYIDIDSKDFDNNSILFNNGYESKIYIYKNNNKELLIKKFYDELNVDKIEKVSRVKSDTLILPKKLVRINNDVVGYTMNYKKNFYPINVMKKIMDDETKYNVLLKLKEEFINLRKQNCIYGDLNLNNVITDGTKIYLCDSLNIKIDNYNFDEISSTMNEYKINKETLEGIDCYMLNLLTIYLFNDIEYDEIINIISLTLSNMFNNNMFIDYIGINNNQECMSICYEMISDDICSKFLVDYIKLEKQKQFNC